MRFLSLLTIFIVTLFSCNKSNEDEIVKTFEGGLPIVTTITPATAVAGQHIFSNVRCQLSSVSGSVYFQGFEIREPLPRNFSISANAMFKDWNTQIALPVMWTLDTIAGIKTTTPGTYVLNFYNSTQLIKSDTVQVN